MNEINKEYNRIIKYNMCEPVDRNVTPDAQPLIFKTGHSECYQRSKWISDGTTINYIKVMK